MKLTFPAEWPLRIALGVAVAAVVLFLVWWATAPFRAAQDAAVARAGGIFAGARQESAANAAILTDQAANTAAQNEQTSRENADVIRQAPGADQPLDPRLNDISRRRVCNRPAYRNSPECVQLLGRPDPPR